MPTSRHSKVITPQLMAVRDWPTSKSPKDIGVRDITSVRESSMLPAKIYLRISSLLASLVFLGVENLGSSWKARWKQLKSI